MLLAGFAADRIADYAATTPVKSRFGLSIEVAIEPFPAGTGGALWHARECLEEQFFLLNGDTRFDIPLLRLGRRLLQEPSAVGGHSVARGRRCGALWNGYCRPRPDHGLLRASGPAGPGTDQGRRLCVPPIALGSFARAVLLGT